MLPDLSRQNTTPVVGRATVFPVNETLKISFVSTHRICTLPAGAAPAAAAPVNANQTRTVSNGALSTGGTCVTDPPSAVSPYGAEGPLPDTTSRWIVDPARTWKAAARHVVSSVGTSWKLTVGFGSSTNGGSVS